MNINYQGILVQVQGQENNINPDSETEERELPPCSFKLKGAKDKLDKNLTWLYLPESTSQNTHLISLGELAAKKKCISSYKQLCLLK